MSVDKCPTFVCSCLSTARHRITSTAICFQQRLRSLVITVRPYAAFWHALVTEHAFAFAAPYLREVNRAFISTSPSDILCFLGRDCLDVGVSDSELSMGPFCVTQPNTTQPNPWTTLYRLMPQITHTETGVVFMTNCTRKKLPSNEDQGQTGRITGLCH